MYPDGIMWVAIIGIIFVWMVMLTWFVIRQNFFLKKLFPKDKGNIKDKLEELFEEIKQLQVLKRDSAGFVQKIVCKRYNPYRDTGGDQSFSMALLDGKGDGVVISSLHSRAGTRVFAKPVKDGKEDQFQLSQEEMEVLKEANLK